MSGLLDMLSGAKKPEKLVKALEERLPLLLDSKDTTSEAYAELESKFCDVLSDMVNTFYGVSSGKSKEEEPNEKDQKRLGDLLLDVRDDDDGHHGGGHPNLLAMLLVDLSRLPFEAKKSVARIYEHLLTHRRPATADYIKARPQLLRLLVEGYGNSDVSVALNCDTILRAALRCIDLCTLVFIANPSLVDPFFRYIDSPSFDTSAPAFSTFRLMLTEHKALSAEYLIKTFDDFFAKYNGVLQSSNYHTKTQCFEFLGELLTTRNNFEVLLRYINDANNLQLVMKSLRSSSPAVQLAVFNVLKIFIANPNKSPGVTRILTLNKLKMMGFIAQFQNPGITDNERLQKEKEEVLGYLARLPDLPAGEIPNSPNPGHHTLSAPPPQSDQQLPPAIQQPQQQSQQT